MNRSVAAPKGTVFTRRDILKLAPVTVLAGQLAAADQRFWETKPPAQWTREEIAWMLNASPWVQPAAVFFSKSRGAMYPQETPPRLSQPPRFTVRWVSAQPVLDALGMQRPGPFAGFHVLNIPGKTWYSKEMSGRHFPDKLRDMARPLLKVDAHHLTAERMEEIQKGPLQGVLFYFRQMTITPQTESILFVSAIGNTEITARFVPAQMTGLGGPEM